MTDDASLDVNELRRRLEECEATLAAIRSGEVDAIVVSDDAGAAKVYALEGADHPYRVLVEAMQQGAVTLSSDGAIVYCNASFAEMVKRPFDAIIGTPIEEFFAPSDRPAVARLVQSNLSERRQRELSLLAADGSELPVLVSTSVLDLAPVQAISVIVTDLTEHRQNEQLKDTDRRKDEFLAMLAHELRNPLAPIANAVQILCLLDENPDSESRAACEIIERQVQQMSRFVDDLLDVSRITRGKINLKMEPVDVAKIAAHAVETSRPLIEARRHQLHIELASQSMKVLGDSVRLTQVVTNLLNNAAKYTEEGGQIWLTVARDQQSAVISVRDNGVGISEEVLPKIFDLFTQANRSIDRAQGGLGIGLTLVRRLVEMHRGAVTARSGGGLPGSEFVVRLPLLVDHAMASERNHARPDRAAARPRRILVVDDNVDSAVSLGMLLKSIGNDIEIAHDGPAALRIAERFEPEIVFLDIGLPRMDGYMVAQKLRNLPGAKKAFLAALTGYGEDHDRIRAESNGFDRYLVKPLDFKLLEQLLNSLPGGSN